MHPKVWRRRLAPPAGFARSLGLPPFQAHLLYNRGIRRPEELDAYMAADLRLANDPMLLPDMGKAVARLERALATGEVIGVFGDFDTDGVTGTALLVDALQELGSRVVPYLPDRLDEGHGLNAEAIESLRAKGVSLLVTVDCGVSSVEEVRLASSMEIDTIITDHHSLPSSIPDALAIVNPRRPDSSYPYHGLTGVGISFKLIEALWAALGRPRPDHLLELVALGTVADVGPLTGENRHLVKWGLERLNETRHPGLRALVARSRLKLGSLDTESLSFGLIPRLNAAGRLGDASLSLELLTATSPEAAERIAEDLERLNDERRLLTAEGVAQAREQVELQSQTVPPIIIVQHREWQPGILGLIAGGLSESFYRPVVAISLGEQVSRASARSIPEFDIVEALQGSSGLFHRFGGHPQAAGFTMPTRHLARLKRDLAAAADGKMEGADLVPTIEIDCEISPALLDDQNFGFIQALRPFGEGNPAPVFLTRNAVVAEARRVGKRRNHLKMRIAHGESSWEAIAFGQGDKAADSGATVDIVYTVGLNDWGGRQTMQLNVLDFRPAH
jgi:single-stranded-DNA-specific exonuclease